ncbi:OmpA family protein [Pseudomonas sp. 8AS]|uniref:OmpA family protein n=1 Tax=Pseudomonas sp. 8AS TaxID=2653163 RepID=UPI0012F2DCA7|nr:OmpA family protein [Pseudomonas sp. 8AS]VXA98131.1 OmpA family protein [Pseudomonas sp. 8AS]
MTPSSSRLFRTSALALAISLGTSSCATVDNTLGNSSGGAACAMGAVAGAILVGGLAVAAGKDLSKGAAIGAAAGCGLTYLYQQRVKRLQAIAKEEGLAMQVTELTATAPAGTGQAAGKVETVGIEAQIQDSSMFNVSSASITPDGQRQLRKIAMALAEGQKDAKAISKKILVVGHTDATGSAAFNQNLSEQRARAVGQILADVGIPASSIYYQGAGASRPVADNSTEDGRAKNRRVEMSEVDSQQLLVERVRVERSNPKYLSHGTASKPKGSAKSTKASKPATQQPSAKLPNDSGVDEPKVFDTPSSQVATVPLDGKGGIDFGGNPVVSTASVLAQGIAPKTSSFSFITPAYASAPLSSCVDDMPRVEGQVKNLETGQALSEAATIDYMPGLNGRIWAKPVNGHVAMVGPVSILKEEAKVAQAPFMQFITNYQTGAKKQTAQFSGSANTYEGEDKVLYRVFANDPGKSPVSCMDIVFDKRSGQAVAGEIYYPKKGDAYVAQFQPVRR